MRIGIGGTDTAYLHRLWGGLDNLPLQEAFPYFGLRDNRYHREGLTAKGERLEGAAGDFKDGEVEG